MKKADAATRARWIGRLAMRVVWAGLALLSAAAGAGDLEWELMGGTADLDLLPVYGTLGVAALRAQTGAAGTEQSGADNLER